LLACVAILKPPQFAASHRNEKVQTEPVRKLEVFISRLGIFNLEVGQWQDPLGHWLASPLGGI
jgi:hypothetical protein